MTKYKDVFTQIASSGHISSQIIETRGFSRMAIVLPAAWTAADIGFYVSRSRNGTFQPLIDVDGTVVQIEEAGGLAASQTYVAPPEVFYAPFVKLWSQNGTGTDVPQGGTRNLYAILTE